MQKHKPFHLVIPKQHTRLAFKMLEKKESRLRYKKEEVYIVMNYLLFRHVNRQKKIKPGYPNRTFFPIGRNHLKQLLGKDPVPFIRFLAQNGVLECDGMYVEGEKCLYYRLNTKKRLTWEIAEVHPGNKQFERILKYHRDKRKHNDRMEPFLKKMAKLYYNMEYDYEGAMKHVKELRCRPRKKIQYLLQIETLADKRTRRFQRNKTNWRLDTSLTNLKSDYRQFLVGDFSHIDAKNSQPYLCNQTICHIVGLDGGNETAFPSDSQPLTEEKFTMSFLHPHTIPSVSTINTASSCCMRSVFSKHEPSETFGKRTLRKIFKIPGFYENNHLSFAALTELRKFGEWVNNGSLYPKLVEYFKDEKLSEASAKKMAFGLIFSKNTERNILRRWAPFEKQKKMFAKAFPFVSEIIATLKINNYKDLAIYLQRVESYMYIDCIARELVAEGIVPLTIHDSIVVDYSDEQRTIEIMQRVFMQHFNHLPTLKATYIGTGNRNHASGESALELPAMRQAKFIREWVAAPDMEVAFETELRESA